MIPFLSGVFLFYLRKHNILAEISSILKIFAKRDIHIIIFIISFESPNFKCTYQKLTIDISTKNWIVKCLTFIRLAALKIISQNYSRPTFSKRTTAYHKHISVCKLVTIIFSSSKIKL